MTGPWKPSVTVAAVVERDGRFLLVEEETGDGIRLNQPAGHLDPGESLTAAVVRETMEETTHAFAPTHLLGAYLWRATPPAGEAATYLRFAFCGELGERDPGRALDHGILRTLWLTREELAARAAQHRSPLVQRCIDDYLSGVRYPLELLFTHASAVVPVVTSTIASAASSALAPAESSALAPADPWAAAPADPLAVEPTDRLAVAPADPSAVAPAQAGAQVHGAADWLPACAGTTRAK